MCSVALSLIHSLELLESQGAYSLLAFMERMEEDGSKSHKILLADPRIGDVKNMLSIAVDSTGIKVTNRGDWLRKKWDKEKKKGYLKIHFAIDPKTKQVVSMDVTREDVHDGTKLKKLVKQASNNVGVGKVIADGAYDSRRNFRFLADNDIEPVIKVRKNASLHVRGCSLESYQY